jgi:hypothetical protein
MTPPKVTVDALFELPETGDSYQVLQGRLVVTPPDEPVNNLASDRLRRMVDQLLAPHLEIISRCAIRVPGGDGEWHETLHPAGAVADLPIVVGACGPEIVSVKLDPAWPVGPRRRPS